MEMSSPLAAMQPPAAIPGPWGYRRDLPPSKPLFGAHNLGSKNFNFRDMSMRKADVSTAGYFGIQPMRGSSPTASLAADMSSNLHVDQRWEGVTTPPIPDSSPSFVPDSMDISPLPHKAPYNSYITLPSPSPEVMPSNDDDMLSPSGLPGLDIQRPASAADRKKSILLRPSLSRTKNFSTNTVSFKQQEQQPAFRFGAGCDRDTFGNLGNTSAPSLDECFQPSPPQDRRPCSNGSLFASSKVKPFPFGSNIQSRNNGSPLAAIRKQSAAHSRPRPSKMRRSLSMFESPGDIMNAKQDSDSDSPSGMSSIMDEDYPSLKLPHFNSSEPESLPRITHETLIQVLDGTYDHLYDEKAIIDCRFEYEYNGGHIEGAMNFCDKEQLAERLFSAPTNNNTLLILHCEYSAHRAPLMAKFVRSQDRKENAHRYPELNYPEVYILDGGYSRFFHANSARCEPQNYLRMDAKEHEQSCERGLNKLRQRKPLQRAQTFAIGQHSCQMEDSPTALGRSKSGGNIFTLGDDSLNGRTGASRRMASY
ncbi:m-phase inducer phosphatase [Didymella pomorum]|uniref:M-phase inducer phosphatase n=1 Tax=Didymella pomorum TaxID=749634 RepID=A0A9W9DBD2_9PLEO|nr:m-phase inducer phosphatase [Didymella pomorum]